MKVILYYLLTIFVIYSGDSIALYCQEPINIQQTGRDWKAKVEGEVRGLAKKILGAGAGAEIDTKVQDLLHKYPNIDKLILETRLSYEICKSIELISDMSEEQKIDRYLKLRGKATSAFGQSISTMNNFNYCQEDSEYLENIEKNRIYNHNPDGTLFVLKDCTYYNFSLSCEILIYNCSEMGIPNEVRTYNGGKLVASHMQLPFDVNSISVHGKTYKGSHPDYYPDIEILPGRKVTENITFDNVTNQITKGIDKITLPFRTKQSSGLATFTGIKIQ